MDNNFNYKSRGAGNWQPPKLGAHHSIIISAGDYTSKKGAKMVKICFDFCEPDPQANFFSKNKAADNKTEWPYLGTAYINAEPEANGECPKRLAEFFNSCEQSNPGFKVKFGIENFWDQFIGLKLGSVFGMVEDSYNGVVKKYSRFRWFCEVGYIEECPIPRDRLLNGNRTPVDAKPKAQKRAESAPAVSEDYVDVTGDSDLPF